MKHREKLLYQWLQIAEETLLLSDQKLREVQDPALRRLLRGVPDGASPKPGTTCNVELYRKFLQEVQSPDQVLPDLLINGFPIVGAQDPKTPGSSLLSPS